MKTYPILIRLLGVLGACVFVAAPLGAAPAASPEPLVDATGQKCADGKYEGSVLKIQEDLYQLYGSNDEFKKDAGAGARPLQDGKLGKVTRKWLGLFCGQHPFKVRAHSFDVDVAKELSRFRIGTGSAAAPAAKAQAEPLLGVEATYRYDPAVLRKPKDVELILARLRALTDRYNDKKLFEDAVRRALKGLVLDAETLARIENFASVDGYMLPSQKVSQLKGASPGLIEKLMLKTDIDYASADDFHMDLEIATGEGPEKAELARYAARIDELARVIHYRIPTTILADLSGATELEPPVAALYLSMAKIEYPSKHLFAQAARARLEWALGMCKANRFRQEGRLAEEDTVKALWALADASHSTAKQLEDLRMLQTRCSEQQLADAKRLTNMGHEVLYAKLENAAELVKLGRAPPLPGQAGPSAAARCGCVHDARDGMTYGFYPLWSDGAGQKLNFDVLSRIGLYGMTIDDKGALNFPAGIKTPPWTLLEAAHRHMTKVDWVLYKNDWRSTGDAGMADLLGKLRQSITQLLRTPFPKADWRGTALATFGLEKGPSAGDGITLRFEGFPATQQDQEALRGFVQSLAADLRKMKPARQLYIMVTQDDIIGAAADGTGSEDKPFSTVNLHALMQQTNPAVEDAPLEDRRRLRAEDLQVLVLMQEPTSSEKLLLRAEIEKALFSTQRVRMLRNVIPVVEYDGVRSGQLNDDIIYFQDNFGGIGFWPLPFVTANDHVDGSSTANHILHAYFSRAGLDGGVVAELIDLICPNRTWLRWLAWISSILAVVAGVTLARCRGCGTRLDSNAFYMAGMVALIVLPFVVIAALVVGDPLFKSDSGVHWLIAALLIGVVIIPGAYGLLKPARELP